jgi:hypothetical protein
MNVADDATTRRTVLVSELTDGILDPAKPMLDPLIDGGTIGQILQHGQSPYSTPGPGPNGVQLIGCTRG